MKKEDLVCLSSWQPLNSGRPAEPAANVKNKACVRCWVSFHFIRMRAALQILWWKCFWCTLHLWPSHRSSYVHSSGYLLVMTLLSVTETFFGHCLWLERRALAKLMPHAFLAYQTPQIWKIWRAVVLPVLNVINHKGIPSGRTSLQMELCVNCTFLPSFP